ncbi:MAG TPA: tetratricopeptide repeat protein [Steroidobacteraceae bacterium]|jgi:tetratricopeptide (TPR) repeat protein|nr:tetratricopeptide repeat protein [Steroidobacteraceae bacterium]
MSGRRLPPNKLLAAAVVALCASLAFDAGAAPKKKEKTIGELSARPVVVQPDQKVEASAARAMDNYRRFLELQKTDPQLRAEALRRLGDLNMEAGEGERMAGEASTIDMQGAEAIKLYSSLLKSYPDYPRNDQVLYQLARAYETTGQPEKALATLDEVVRRYPKAPQMDEVQFRRGELLFSAKDYHGAQTAYQFVVSKGDKAAFLSQSLYKHGWSLFKQGLNDESLPSFAGVLDRTMLAKNTHALIPIDKLPRANRELADDTLRVMAVTFSYDEDSVGAIDKFLVSRNNPAYAPIIYSRLGDLYVEKERFQDAASVYRAFATREPNNEFSPGLSMQAIDAYRKGGFTELVLEGKREYVALYNYGTPFWAGRNKADYPNIAKELKTNLKDVATYFHAEAQKTKKVDQYREAARWYRTYLESFPDDPESFGTNYLLSEALYSSEDYQGAAAEFAKTAYDYPRNPRSAAAAYAALGSYTKYEEKLPAAEKAEAHKLAVDAGVKFGTSFPEHPDSAGVLTRAAEDIFATQDLQRSIEVANLVLAHQPPADQPKRRIAYTIIGQANFDLLQFPEAEKGYIAARDLLPPNDKMRADLTERIASAVYRQGEAKQKAGDSLGAVDDFLRISQVAGTSKIASQAEYDAGAQLINLKEWPRAIQVLERFRTNNPKSEFTADVTRKLAVAYGETGQAGQAAVEFERIATNPAESKDIQREANLQAADLYAKAGNTPKAVGMLERFVITYPTPVIDSIEARWKLAEIAGTAGNLEKQRSWQREIVNADRAAGAGRTDRTQYLAAKSQLALATPARDEYRSIPLVLPLKTSLAKKRKAMEAALGGYKAAADYRVAEVTTVATYEIAQIYLQLGKDIMKSERPKKLAGDSLDEYNSLLEEQAFPFEEQAITTHEINTKRAREGVYDEGVKKSYAALAELKPGRYGKSEILSASLDALVPPAPPPPANPSPILSGGATPADPTAAPVTAAAAAPTYNIPKPPARANTEFTRALTLMRGGDPTQAILEMQVLTQSYPDLSGPYANLGILHRNANQLPESEAALAKATERAPWDAQTWSEYGITLRQAGKFAEARAAYEHATKANPSYAPAHRNLGVLLDLFLDDPVTAQAELETYKTLTGEDKPVSGWLAELRARNKVPAKAPAPDATPKPEGG